MRSAAIALNDFEIGQKGAVIINDDWSGAAALTTRDVEQPRFRLWIDCSLLRLQGIDYVKARAHAHADVTVRCGGEQEQSAIAEFLVAFGHTDDG